MACLICCDPAQSQDFAGISVCRYRPVGNLTIDPVTGDYLAGLDCLHLERHRGLSYTKLASVITTLGNDSRMDSDYPPVYVIDGSGVGAALRDIMAPLVRDRVLISVVFTGGQSEGPPTQKWVYHVSKAVIVRSLIAALERKTLQIAPDSKYRDVVIREAMAWRVKVTQSANEVYTHMDSEHDDLVCALALATHAASSRRIRAYLPSLEELHKNGALSTPNPESQFKLMTPYERMVAETAEQDRHEKEQAELWHKRRLGWTLEDVEGSDPFLWESSVD